MNAYFRFTCPPATDTFVIELCDSGSIEHARALIAGITSSKPHVSGVIVKQPVDYNLPWKFHLDPASITFFDFATEVCDAAIQYVEEHLADVGGSFLPNGRWCAWSSRITEEIPSGIARDEVAIRAVPIQMAEAWNSGNGEHFAAPFSEDADFVAFEGTHLKGRRQIAAFHQDLFSTAVKGTIWPRRSSSSVF